MKTWTTRFCVLALIVGPSALLPTEPQLSNPSPEQARKAEPAYGEIYRAPDKARAKKNPLERDRDAVAAGAILFERHCAECHGAAAEGGKKGPNLRVNEVQNAEPGAIFWILTNGVVRKGMPVWSKLPEPQRWQLVSYVKSLGVEPGKTRTSAPATSKPSTEDLLLRRR